MLTHFRKYKVEILKNVPFITPEGKTYKHTAAISFFNEENEEIGYLEKGFVTTEEIYEQIYAEKDIDVSYCYIQNFSMYVYRKYFDLEKNSRIKIKSFRANESIFESRIATDFSFTEFENGNFFLSHSIFLKGSVLFNNSLFGEGTKDLSYIFLRKGDFDFSSVVLKDGKFILKNSILGKGEKTFKDTVFGNGEKNFANIDFGEGDVQFIHTSFNEGKVSFKISHFGVGEVDFHYSSFGKGDISFERTIFERGDIDFSKIEFGEGKINFNRAILNGNISFEGSELKNGKISFKKAIFGHSFFNCEELHFATSNVILDSAFISEVNISFNRASINTLSLKSCNINRYLDLRLKYCNELDLSDTIVRDIIDLFPEYNNIEIKTLKFPGMRLLGTLLIDWEKNKIKELIINQKLTSTGQKAEQFRILKKNFSDIGRYNDEDKAYLEFKRYEALDKKQQILKKNRYNAIWYMPLYWSKLLIFDKMGHYATNPLRVLFSMVVVYSSFSLLYFLMIIFKLGDIVSGIGGAHAEISSLSKSFFFAAITFLTIGYGDFYPMGTIRFLSSIEGFTGVFLMSYFTVAFVRKILR